MTLAEVAAYLERAARDGVDEYDHVVLEVLAPVLLSTPGLIARAVAAAIETGHGDEIAEALAEHAAETAQIETAQIEDRCSHPELADGACTECGERCTHVAYQDAMCVDERCPIHGSD